MKYRAYMQCGASFETARIFGPEDGFNVDKKTGRLRVVVLNMDPGSKSQRPKNPDGTSAECLDCKCRRAAGRKEQRVFVTNSKGDMIPGKRPAPLVTCLIASQCQDMYAASVREIKEDEL